MRTRGLILAAGFAVIAGLPAAASAQWMRLQRCSGALPCAIPFGVRYAPDPLIASQYGFISPNSLSGRITFSPALEVELDKPAPSLTLDARDFAGEAARRFILAHPAPSQPPTPDPKTKPTSD
jgi:hypothetical protein